jgi:hypothetical protein
MKIKFAVLSMVLFSCSGSAFAADNVSTDGPKEIKNLSDAVIEGKFKGLVRYSGQYRDSNLHSTQDSVTPDPEIRTEKIQQYSAIGGYLGYETAPWFYTSIGVTVYTGLPFGNNPDDKRGLGGLYEENGKQKAYIALGEAFLKFQTEKHRAVIGRQEMPNYRFVSLSNVRMSPFTHEGVSYENRSLDGFQFNAAYITRQKDRNAFDFEDMVRAARVKTGCGAIDLNGNCIAADSKNLIRGEFNPANFDFSGNYSGADKGMGMAALTYAGDGLSLEAWNYYADDFVNTLYLYGQYNFKPTDSKLILTAAGQYANQQDVDGHVAGDVDTWFYGLKLQAFYEGLTVFTSYNEVSYNEDSYDGGTIFVRWGTPQMFNSFQVQDSELAGTKSIGVGLQYDFGLKGIIPGVLMRVRYADYNLPDSLSDIDARQDRTETTFDVRYSFEQTTGFGLFNEIEGLSILFRVAYNDYRTDYDFAAYKAVHGYEFESVTNNFMDYRLYLDYKF